MKTTWKGLLAGTAAFAIAACTPPAEDGAETAEVADEAEAGEDTMMAEDADAAETPEAGAEAAAEENERDPHGNPAGPLRED